MDLSGVIFVALAIAWAGYLIPKVLKHHDEAARTRPIDTFSQSMRVLTPGAAGTRSRGAAAGSTQPGAGGRAAPATSPTLSRERIAAQRTAARVAARRRRRILVVLLVCDLAATAAVVLGRAPRWAVAVPVALTLLFLVLCRTQVRREVAAPVAAADVVPPVVDEEHLAPEVTVDAHRVADFDDEREDTMGVSVAELQEALVPTADGGTLWDPLPVTLPTYVTKPAARRTVRTIDLGAPGTWTSGRTDADAAIAAYAAEQAAGDTGEDPAARAVNG